MKFSGNKGWHVQIPVELKRPFRTYQEVYEAIINKESMRLEGEEREVAIRQNLLEAEGVKSYSDPFFAARRFVDLVGARVMFYELEDIESVLTLRDIRKLNAGIRSATRDDFSKPSNIFYFGDIPVIADVPQLISINPYSRYRRAFKLLIDHSSNKREGKLRAVFSLHSKTALASIPVRMAHDDRGVVFPKPLKDYDFVAALANPERVIRQLNGESTDRIRYPYKQLMNWWIVNEDLSGFERFIDDHRGLLVYLLQNRGEKMELLDTNTALWVNSTLWEKTIGGRA